MMDSRANTPLKSSDYASSHDDIFGVQRNWFTALYKQLNYMNNTGMVQGSFKGRQREVFESVEKEFEVLYERYFMGSDLKGVEHRAVLMVCLAVATHKVLSEEIGDPNVVREIIRTNQGSMMMAFLLPVHRFKIWLLRYLLAEDPFKQAVGFLPALQADMGGLCEAEVVRGPLRSTTQQEDKGSSSTTTTESHENLDDTASSSSSEPSVSSPSTSSSQSTGLSTPNSNIPQINSSASSTYYNSSNHGGSSDTSKGSQKQAGSQENEVSLVVTKCKYHEILTREDTPSLLSEFCCQHGMTWMKDFQRHGVEVGFERSRSWEDDCCVLRVAKRM
ncbi:hypothetical protein CEUSTIGMA_g10719.t1 [Chlamydomonas eustigma]|uniref:Uncharacterized protein n=1 Tax=Chlamydomonas eustigma TaxID=1157962 RepID=A0A250XJS9_9CHLO|nr:hypothetical protein CEUSTIGMA_g10719.t1 [Chlamydomonas eustigma]|eukprot:GAX83293.1 hypothetical protein CEUSTIGMA_g10719.t1 [Chlamydomonas eustigma]